MNDQPYSDDDERELADRECRAEWADRERDYADGVDGVSERKGKRKPFDPVAFRAWAYAEIAKEYGGGNADERANRSEV